MVNKVTLIGRLGKDPEVKEVSNGKKVAKMSVATDRYGADKPDWHNVIAWDKLAENCQAFLTKGSRVYIEGRINYRKYEKDGETKYSTDIVAYTVNFLDPKKQTLPDAPSAPDMDEDLPF